MRIGSPDDKLHFKNSDGQKAFMSIQDLMSEVPQLTDSDNGARLIFKDVNALINAGWVID